MKVINFKYDDTEYTIVKDGILFIQLLHNFEKLYIPVLEIQSKYKNNNLKIVFNSTTDTAEAKKLYNKILKELTNE